ncbi:MAG: hypothetical protein RMK89_13120, partial [Armatimonadota bacterium]|nr:hypothetical protein [Armatimonadota bacterium]MDW8144389.1 hypothetical protein [Armatimonadota bacterium]
MPPKSLEKLEDSVTLAELLDEYAEHLFWWLNWMRKRRRSEPIEAHVILATREDLWEAMKRRPDGLTKEQR